MRAKTAQMNPSAAPSSVPTQTHPSKATSPTNEDEMAAAKPALGDGTSVAGTGRNEVVDLRTDPDEGKMTMTHLIRQDIVECAAAYLLLDITDARRVTLNFKPQNAERNLNSTVQTEIAEATGIPDLPQNIFAAKYFDPPAEKASIYGYFRLTIPSLLKDYIPPMVTTGGALELTGDDDGNVYKLTLKEYVAKVFKETKRKANKEQWFHLIVDEETPKSMRELLTATDNHIGKWGFKVMDHPDAFKRLPTEDKEQGSVKIHVEYEVDLDRVPLDGWGHYFFEEIDSVLLNPLTNERGKLWFAPRSFHKLYGACNLCGINVSRCKGHEKKKVTGVKRTTAAENMAAAQARIAQRGKKKFTF